MSRESLSAVDPNDPWDVFQEKYLPEGEERQDIVMKDGRPAPRRITLRRADRKLPVRHNKSRASR